MKRILLLWVPGLLFALLFQNSLSAQDTVERTVGISGTVQTSQAGIMIPIWVAKTISIAPAIGLAWVDGTGTDFTFGLVPKFYFRSDKLAPYIALRGGCAFFFPDKASDESGDHKTTDWIAGLGFGAEYFFNPMFSVGAEFQGNATKSDKNSLRFSNPGKWNFNLATMITVNVFFLKKVK